MKNKNKNKIDKNKIDTDVNVYPLDIDTSKLNEIDCYPLIDVPFFIVACGRVRAGKSVLINNLVLDDRNLYGPKFDIKIFISPCALNDPMNQYIIDEFDYCFTEYSDALLDRIIDMISEDESDSRYLLVLDDIIGVMDQKRTGKLDSMTKLITRYRHVGNGDKEGKLSILISTQYWKYVTGIIRTNCTGYYLLGSFPESEIKKISEDLSYFGGDNRKFIELYKEARRNDNDGNNFNFMFMNVKKGEVRKNHDKLIWDAEHADNIDDDETINDE